MGGRGPQYAAGRQLTSPAGETATQFALRCADALLATPNLRRTLARVVTLAVPRLGAWCALSLVDGTTLHQSVLVDGEPLADRQVDLRRPRSELAGLVAALRDGHRLPDLDEAQWSACHGHPADRSHSHAASPFMHRPVAHRPVAHRLVVGGRERGVLVVGGSGCPDPDELAGLVTRAQLALSTAVVFEERARLAAQLRDAVRPAALPRVPGLEVGTAYRPAHATTDVGGDFFELHPFPDGRCTFSFGDVSGHGTDAAVVSAQVRRVLRTAGWDGDGPAATVRLVNETLLAQGCEHFVTLVHGVARRARGGVDVELANAGHAPALLLRSPAAAGPARVETLGAPGTVVGLLPETRVGEARCLLAAGDALVLVTDGTTEARGPGGMLGTEPLVVLLRDSARLTAQAIADRLAQRVLEHVGRGEHDDIAVLVLRNTGPVAA